MTLEADSALSSAACCVTMRAKSIAKMPRKGERERDRAKRVRERGQGFPDVIKYK